MERSAGAMWRHPIVVGVDGSPASVRAARLGTQLAQATGASLRLAHAVPDPGTAVGFGPMEVAPPEFYDALLAGARAELRVALAPAVPSEVLDALDVRIGPTARVLAAQAAESHAGVVVVGGKEHGALARAFGRSTAHSLVRLLDVPVLVAGHASRPLRRVLAAVDLATASEPVIAAAQRLAALLDARVRVLHVVEPVRFPSSVVQLRIDETEIDARAEAALRALLARFPEIPPASGITRHGAAAEAIAGEAADWEADLLVVGSHGRGWVDRLVLGSTTERLLSLLPANLLVLPLRGD